VRGEEELMIIFNGIRYRFEDALELGLIGPDGGAQVEGVAFDGPAHAPRHLAIEDSAPTDEAPADEDEAPKQTGRGNRPLAKAE
jgi:hypothetical protein